MKTGLVMEGGAMRGMFTCGVMDVMLENGISFDGAVGVSAGAVLGCNYKSKQIGRGVRYSKKYCTDYRYGSWKSYRKTGNLYDVDFCYYKLPGELDVFDREAYVNNPMEFYVTVTDVTTGKAIYHKCDNGIGEDIEWFRASASMPIVSEIVEIGGNKYLDGGIADSIPLRFMQEKGYERNVVILTQPADYVKKKNKFLPLARVKLRKYPEMIKAMADRHFRYNATTKYIREQEERGYVYVIRPPRPLEIGSMEDKPEELERVYQIGRETGNKYVSAIKNFLAKGEQDDNICDKAYCQ